MFIFTTVWLKSDGQSVSIGIVHGDSDVYVYYYPASLSDWFILLMCPYLDPIIAKEISWKMKVLQRVLLIKCSKHWCQLCCRQCQVWQLQSLSGLTGFQRSTDVCVWFYNNWFNISNIRGSWGHSFRMCLRERHTKDISNYAYCIQLFSNLRSFAHESSAL